jgi:hypothetical protein
MFLLNNKTLGVSPSECNLINITYYSSKQELLDIFNINFPYNPNIIPLAISFLESKPILLHGKKYNTLDGEIFIQQMTLCKSKPNENNDYFYGSFIHDIKEIDNQHNIIAYKKKIIKSLDYEITNIYSNPSKVSSLVRIYNLEPLKNINYTKNVLNEKEQFLLIWEWDYINFQLIIPKDTILNKQPTIYQIQINIDITEEKNLISNFINYSALR